jgi:hypothetical protein
MVVVLTPDFARFARHTAMVDLLSYADPTGVAPPSIAVMEPTPTHTH